MRDYKKEIDVLRKELEVIDKIVEDRRREYELDIETFREMRNNRREEIDKIKHDYQMEHTRDFYRPMDEIDIQDQIRREGYIIGIRI